MTQFIQAIYENGVFKPLEPLVLPESARVKLAVEAETAPVASAVDADVIARQTQALRELWEAVDRLPQTRNNDNWSVRDHDTLLYGEP